MPLQIAMLLIGFVAGLAGGMFGLGGGAIMVPAMVLLLHLDQKLATGTSIAAQVLPIGILAAIVYYRQGNLNIRWGLILALGLVIGNLLGALFANQQFISGDMLKKAYGVFLIAIAIRYLFWK